MAWIQVLRPDGGQTSHEAFARAARGELPARVHLTLIENSKPNAESLMLRVAERLGRRLSIEIEVFHKPSAGKPIDADEARMLAARSHLILTGLGD
jgi:hypothetical protein